MVICWPFFNTWNNNRAHRCLLFRPMCQCFLNECTFTRATAPALQTQAIWFWFLLRRTTFIHVDAKSKDNTVLELIFKLVLKTFIYSFQKKKKSYNFFNSSILAVLLGKQSSNSSQLSISIAFVLHWCDASHQRRLSTICGFFWLSTSWLGQLSSWLVSSMRFFLFYLIWFNRTNINNNNNKNKNNNNNNKTLCFCV